MSAPIDPSHLSLIQDLQLVTYTRRNCVMLYPQRISNDKKFFIVAATFIILYDYCKCPEAK